MTATQRRTLILSAAPRQQGPLASPGWASLAWRPDGKILATALPRQGLIKLWRVDDGGLTAFLRGPGPNAGLLQWSPDGKTLAAAYEKHTVVLWDALTRKQRAALRGNTGRITALAWCPGGRALATASEDGSLRIWDGATGRERVALYSLDGGTEWLAITPDGYFAASSHGAGLIQWRQGNKLWPGEMYRRHFERPDFVRRALSPLGE